MNVKENKLKIKLPGYNEVMEFVHGAAEEISGYEDNGVLACNGSLEVNLWDAMVLPRAEMMPCVIVPRNP